MTVEERRQRPGDCTLCPYDYVAVAKRPVSAGDGDDAQPLKKIKLQ
eukprot:CAMPEP_0197536922 /NCGR_PEP_ID=MMETSP1318-20131121/55328_1 /TAXON_ID=552666 /ORGANISM="Partenskyella glossopodia, Strain RCC365" /LENGTH=45 /DNA_ID= /DNA_START= /DNA_END= /DNA_ORIENTATION=